MSKRIYFPNLDGLRFIAAALVILSHVEQFKKEFNLPNIWSNEFIHNMGGLGVYLFFTLSGFLITFLLLKEKEVTGTISIKQFYIRRILRIWPLYFLTVMLGFFVLPHLPIFQIPNWKEGLATNFWEKFLLFFFFFSNLALVMFYPPVSSISQNWSVSTEEQFYLLWPQLIKKTTKYIHLFILVVVIYWLLRFGLIMFQYYGGAAGKLEAVSIFNYFLFKFCISCMAIGGFGAWLVMYGKPKWKNLLFDRKVEVIAILAAVLMIFVGHKIHKLVKFEVFSVLFMVVIINAACNPKSLLNLEHKVFRYLGKVSYGLYMFHPILLPLIINLLLSLNIYNNLLLYVLTFAVTILVSGLSYEYFEKRALVYKDKFTVILSGKAH
jgi:peptidoglycan/LPS O-acetylase OafA/YrhL